MVTVHLVLLVLAAACQLGAAVRALYLLRITGRRWSWMMVAAALLLMEGRRLFVLRSDDRVDAVLFDALGLAVSALLLAGVWGLGDFFVAIERSEERLRASRQRYRALLEQSSEGFILLDTSTRKVRETNRRFLEMTGYSEAEVAGLPLETIFEGSPSQLAETTDKLLSGTETMVGERSCRRKDGSLFEAEVSKGVVRLGKEGDILVSVRDLSERNRLRVLAESMHSTRSLEMIFTGLRDSLGNPLNTGKVSLDVLRTGWSKLEDPKKLEYIERVHQQFLRIEELLKALGSFFGGRRSSRIVFDLGSLLATSVDMFRTEPAAVGVAWKLEPLHGPLKVKGDPAGFLIAVGNVLSNALDAVGGRADPTISVAVSTDGDRVTVRVADNGCGIPEDVRLSLFHPFASTKPGSIGLGLVRARKHVVDMGGTLSLDSVVERGTTVTFLLPAVKDAA
jgi:PAS domain S-box-containing protein